MGPATEPQQEAQRVNAATDDLGWEAGAVTSSSTEVGEMATPERAPRKDDLPDGWRQAKLSDLAHLRLGRTPARAESRFWSDGTVPWVSIADLPNGLVGTTRERISTAAHREVFRGEFVPAGTLLMSFKLSVGKVGILAFPAVHNEAIVSFRLDQSVVDRDFLFFALQSMDFDAYLDAYVKGKTLNKDKLSALPIALPDVREQRAIAHVLRTVQQAREATEAVIVATRELKRSLMRHLFTYGPVPVVDAEQVPLTGTEFGEVPSHWSIVALDRCAYVQTGVTKGRHIDASVAIEVPYLRVANVQDGYLDLSEMKTIRMARDEVGRYQLQPRDVLVTEGGDFDKLGRGFIWRGQMPGAVHQNHVFAIRADPSVVLPEFLAYLVQTRYAKEYFLTVAHRTTHLACINSTKLKSLPTPVPPFAEQECIVSRLQSVDRKLAAEESRAKALGSLFTTLLHHLMTGKMQVSDSVGLAC